MVTVIHEVFLHDFLVIFGMDYAVGTDTRKVEIRFYRTCGRECIDSRRYFIYQPATAQ